MDYSRKMEAIQIYNDFLEGKRKGFSPYFFQRQHRDERVRIILTYLLEEKLNVPKSKMIGLIDKDFIKRYKLHTVISYIEKPKESLEDDYNYIIFYLYPDLNSKTEEDVVIDIYKEILDDVRNTFPRGYFKGVEGEFRASVCFKYLCEKVLKLKNNNEIKETFKGQKGLHLLAKYKLKIITTLIYDNCEDLVSSVYPN